MFSSPLHKSRSLRACVLALLLFAACDDAGSRSAPLRDASGSAPDAADDAGADRPSPSADLSDEDSDYLFDEDELRTFELRVLEEDLAYLDADPMAEQYVPGELFFEGSRVAPVGVRYKGSTGGFVGCLSDSFFPPAGSKVCPKLSIKVKVDYGDRDAKFYGQKKLLFHAMNGDPSLMRERLSYGLFREMGVHAPRTVHVRLLVNGELSGVYLLVEEIDGQFTRSRFEDGGRGNLYKEVWPTDDDHARYLEGLETNRNDDPSVDKIVAFARALAGADDETLPSVLEAWMDLDHVARYIAVDRTILHDDGPFHWYCRELSDEAFTWHRQHVLGDLECGNHNFYLYEETSADRLWLVPWDLDDVIGNRGLLSITDVRSVWDDLDQSCAEPLPEAFRSPRELPSTCDPLQRAWALALRERVHEAVRELLDGPMSEAEVERKIRRWAEQIARAVEEASEAHWNELTVPQWVGEMNALYRALQRLRASAPGVASEMDAGLDDAGTSDGGPPDGEPDAAIDGGVPDAAIDGGEPDASIDAGQDAHVADAGGPSHDASLADAGADANAADAAPETDGAADAGAPHGGVHTDAGAADGGTDADAQTAS